MSKKNNFIVEIVMLLVTFIIAYPLILLLLLSVKTSTEITMSPFALPTSIEISNFTEAFAQMDYLTVLKNTLIMTVGATAISVYSASMAAYACMRAKKLKWLFRCVYIFFLLGYILPEISALITMNLWLKDLSLDNSLIGIILVFSGASMAYGIFLISRFVNTIPLALEESAMIDGANPIRVFFSIALPILQPAMITFLILRSVAIWNDFLTPLVLLQGAQSRTMSLAIYFFKGEYGTQWNLLFAGLILSIIPIIILYFIFQKRIVGGLVAGAVKS